MDNVVFYFSETLNLNHIAVSLG